ncbi:1841_t:CDS:2, partial [Ambispora gerdemannii]
KEIVEEGEEEEYFYEKLAKYNLSDSIAKYIFRRFYLTYTPNIYAITDKEQKDNEAKKKLTYSLGNITLLDQEKNIQGSNKLWKFKRKEHEEKTCLDYEKKLEGSKENPNPNFFSRDNLLPEHIQSRTKFFISSLKHNQSLIMRIINPNFFTISAVELAQKLL